MPAPTFAASERGPIWDRLRSIDWSSSSVGPLDRWPNALRAMLRTVVASKQPIALCWGPELVQFHNEAYLPVLAGRASDPFGAPFREVWSDIWPDVAPYVEIALSGQGASVEDLPLRMLRYGRAELTYWSFHYSPLYDDAGEIAGVLNILTETTKAVEVRRAQVLATDALTLALGEAQDEIDEQRKAAEVRAVVQRELAHRLKNAYAMVQAIVSQTLRHARSLDDAGPIIASRIQAMSAAQEVLTRSSDDKAEILDVVSAALRPHQDMARRIEIVGPNVTVSAQQGMGLALAIHELATNAAKYGGLSADAGSARASWAYEGDAFTFGWSETGGPPVLQPERRGFGTRLLERVIPSYFRGEGRLAYEGEGVRYDLRGSLSSDAGGPG